MAPLGLRGVLLKAQSPTSFTTSRPTAPPTLDESEMVRAAGRRVGVLMGGQRKKRRQVTKAPVKRRVKRQVAKKRVVKAPTRGKKKKKQATRATTVARQRRTRSRKK